MLKKYEALFVFVGSLKDEALEKTLERVNAEIERLGGTIESNENLGRRTFARPMKKRDNGVYVKTLFFLEPDKIATLRARYRLSEDVFRVQIRNWSERYEAARKADQERRAAHRKAQEAAAEAAAAEAAAAAAADAEEADEVAAGADENFEVAEDSME